MINLMKLKKLTNFKTSFMIKISLIILMVFANNTITTSKLKRKFSFSNSSKIDNIQEYMKNFEKIFFKSNLECFSSKFCVDIIKEFSKNVRINNTINFYLNSLIDTSLNSVKLNSGNLNSGNLNSENLNSLLKSINYHIPDEIDGLNNLSQILYLKGLHKYVDNYYNFKNTFVKSFNNKYSKTKNNKNINDKFIVFKFLIQYVNYFIYKLTNDYIKMELTSIQYIIKYNSIFYNNKNFLLDKFVIQPSSLFFSVSNLESDTCEDINPNNCYHITVKINKDSFCKGKNINNTQSYYVKPYTIYKIISVESLSNKMTQITCKCEEDDLRILENNKDKIIYGFKDVKRNHSHNNTELNNSLISFNNFDKVE